MRNEAVAFETCEPSERTDDFAFLKDVVGNARIVALGESTHGTREFFQLKHRIVQYLASEMGFTVFAIEANLPEAWRVNDYVSGGSGDPRALLAGMHFWTWNTEEVLSLIEWMRAFNASGKGRIEFTGFDMQFPDTASAVVRRFLERVDPAWADSVPAGRMLLSDPGRVTCEAELNVAALIGKRLRVSGVVRAEQLDGQAGLFLWVDGKTEIGEVVEDTQEVAPHVSPAWTGYAVEAVVPMDATRILIGTYLSGSGRAWFDSLAIEVDGKSYTPAGLDLALERADGPYGFKRTASHFRYMIRMDEAQAFSGRRSLRLTAAPFDTAITTSARRLVRHMEARQAAYARRASAREIAWAIRNAHVVLQSALPRAGHPFGPLGGGRGDTRDSCMAANVIWTAEVARPGEKVVLWAHNLHVGKTRGWMGHALAERYGDDYLAMSLTTGGGTYTANGSNTYTLQEPPAGSLEALAERTSLPRFILDLRPAASRPEVAASLARLPARALGAVANDAQFRVDEPITRYDLLAWIHRTEATRRIH